MAIPRSSQTLPALLSALSERDRYQYACLHASISSSALQSPNRSRALFFSEALDAIKSFVVRNDQDDVLRGMVCGIHWVTDGLAMNIRQLRVLIPKCKSSINGSLKKLGFTANMRLADANSTLSVLFPMLRDNAAERRKWTIRQREGRRPAGVEERLRFVIPLEGLAGSRVQEERACSSESDIADGICLPPEPLWKDEIETDFLAPVTEELWINMSRE
jgi:hypothetical protein